MPSNQASWGRGTHTKPGLTARTRIQGSSKYWGAVVVGFYSRAPSLTVSAILQAAVCVSVSTLPSARAGILSSSLFNFSLPRAVHPHSSCFLRMLDCHNAYCIPSSLSFKPRAANYIHHSLNTSQFKALKNLIVQITFLLQDMTQNIGQLKLWQFGGQLPSPGLKRIVWSGLPRVALSAGVVDQKNLP